MDKVVKKINNFIRSRGWFDFEVKYFSETNLRIVGGIELEYYSELEIVFEDVFFVSCALSWRTDTSQDAIHILQGREAYDFNVRNNIQQGYSIFEIIPEYFDREFYVVAKRIKCIISNSTV